MKHGFPQLHVFLGAGGVGKTTLSAGYALHLASQGAHVGLLSIDPARRLASALGIDLGASGEEVVLPIGKGSVRISMVSVETAFKRFVQERGLSQAKQEALFANPYFASLTKGFASSMEVFAGIHVAEWFERFPETEHIVIDTAPGLHALDFLTKPEKVLAFLDGKLIDWLRWFVGDVSGEKKGSLISRLVKSGARKILDGLSHVGGKGFILYLGEFFLLLDEILVVAVQRLKLAQEQLISHKRSSFYIISGVREDAFFTVKSFMHELKHMVQGSTHVVLNRTLPAEELLAGLKGETNTFVNSICSQSELQMRLMADLTTLTPSFVCLPMVSHLSSQNAVRQEDLCDLGQQLRNALCR